MRAVVANSSARVSTPRSFLTPSRAGLLQRTCACGGTPGPSGECEECRKKRQGVLQRRATGPEPDEVPPIVHDVLRSPGQPLDAETRAFMEPRFGHDFSQVRVHTDAAAAASADAVNALAYTVGSHIVFAGGRTASLTRASRGLLAHELVHVVQQRGGGGIAPTRISRPDDRFEVEATRCAGMVSAGGTASEIVHALPTPVLARGGKIFGADAGTPAGGASPALCGGSWTCSTPGNCNRPDRTGGPGPSTSWQLIIRIDTEAPSAAAVTASTVGHTYVEFRESNGTVYTYGFYPSRATDPFLRPTSPGCMVHPDTAHAACVDYSETFNLTQAQYTAALDGAQSVCRFPSTYHVLNTNCTTFAIGIALAAGQSLPSPRGPVSGAAIEADNPNTLRDALRSRAAARRRSGSP